MSLETKASSHQHVSKVFIIFVNGKKIEDHAIDPEWRLLYYLRYKLFLTGTKLSCGEGGCGACTVMVSKYSQHKGTLSHYTVNACLTPLASMHGMAVTTVEGIGSLKKSLHVVQERIAKAHGSQCGFCTPGMVMSMYTLLRNNPSPSIEEIQENLTGNLCRCTGYRPILEGFGSLAKGQANSCGKSDCCQLRAQENGNHAVVMNGQPNTNGGTEEGYYSANNHIFSTEGLLPYDPTQEIIFPPELRLNSTLELETLQFCGPKSTYWRPTTVHHLLSLKHHHPEAKIIVGNTEVGIETYFKDQVYPVLINGSYVPELTCIKILESGLKIGASLSFREMEVVLKDLVMSRAESTTRSMQALIEVLHLFAGNQIRNVASIGGNIMTSSPVSDINPFLMAVGATLTFKSLKDGDRILLVDDSFFTGYRKNAARPQEVLISVFIPFTEQEEFIETYKQSRRRDDDIAIVNATMKVKFLPGSLVISHIILAFGGMAATTIMAKRTMAELEGLEWNNSLLEKGTSLLSQELYLPASAPGGMVHYRRTLTLSFFFKFYLSVHRQLECESPGSVLPLQDEEFLATKPFHIPAAKGCQVFEQNDDGENSPVGKPMIHNSAFKQATGEAIFVDDIPSHPNDLHAAFVLSTRAHATILKINATPALEMHGVTAFFCAKDLPGERNITGIYFADEEVFRRNTVQCIGQVIGVVIAEDQDTARSATKLVEIDYEDLPSPLFTIEDAIKAKSSWGPWSVKKGNVEDGFSKADHVLEGEMHMGGQEHFYMEANAHIAIPKEGNEEMEVISSTQSLAGIQNFVAKAVGISANKIVVKAKHVGGAFGGKITRQNAFCIPIAVASSKLDRVVRTAVDRHEDMVVTGGRHPLLCRWKVGVSNDGDLTALKVTLYANAGCSLDLSMSVVNRIIFTIDNAYKHTNIEATGYACKTNLPSNTAFRGFGSPQAVMFVEDIMSSVAAHIGMDPRIFREKNMYWTEDINHMGLKLENCNIRRCWSEVIEQSNMEERIHVMKLYNSRNRYRKRGLAVTPVNFGIGNIPISNKGGALVHIYTDGSVLISHGGIEMGQGLHTKMIQVASQILGIPVSKIHISDTATDKVPNAASTAASVSSDLYGMAIKNACQELMNRLEPYKKKTGLSAWKDMITAAHLDKVSLSCIGYHSIDEITGFDFDKQRGRPFLYYTQGAAVSEVEIDCLTGDHMILRTDIVMDVGNSLNPAIDIGQIEGAFMQGVGLITLEELLYTTEGALLTKGPGAYKIPGVHDIPRELNVSLLKDAPNPQAVYSSKAVAEPPLLLAISVFQAIKAAIGTFREEQGLSKIFRLDSPATSERIRLACQDSLVKMSL